MPRLPGHGSGGSALIELDLSFGPLVNAASGLLFVAMGAFALSIRPVRPDAWAFGLFAMAMGLVLVPNNILADAALWRHPVYIALFLTLLAAAAVFLARFGLLAPSRAGRGDRRAVLLAGAFATVFWLAVGPVAIVHGSATSATANASLNDAPALARLEWMMWIALMASFLFVSALLALRWPRLRETHLERRALVFAGAIGLWPAAIAGEYLRVPTVTGTTLGLAGSAAVLVLSALWLRNALTAASRGPRDLAMLLPGIVVIGAIVTILHVQAGGDPRVSPAPGVARLLGVCLLAYGVLRHQVFGFELRIKWTLGRGTLAALFVAAFFVASEIVSGLLSERIGLVAGVLATGILVFALAPLQRLADRVADTAMPHVQDTEDYRTVHRREVYRSAVEAACRDAEFTQKERAVLATLADELGLTGREAAEIEEGVIAGRT